MQKFQQAHAEKETLDQEMAGALNEWRKQADTAAALTREIKTSFEELTISKDPEEKVWNCVFLLIQVHVFFHGAAHFEPWRWLARTATRICHSSWKAASAGMFILQQIPLHQRRYCRDRSYGARHLKLSEAAQQILCKQAAPHVVWRRRL